MFLVQASTSVAKTSNLPFHNFSSEGFKILRLPSSTGTPIICANLDGHLCAAWTKAPRQERSLFKTPVFWNTSSLLLSISLLTLLAVFIRTGLVVDDSSIKTMASVPELLSFWRFSIFFFCTYVFNIIESANSSKCNLNEQAQDANGSIFCSVY